MAADAAGTFAASNPIVVTAEFASAGQCFLAHVYLDRLARPIDAVGLAGWSSELARGVTRRQVVRAIEMTPEGRESLVRGLYRLYPGRDAEPAGRASFVRLLRRGARPEGVIARIVGSVESFQ